MLKYVQAIKDEGNSLKKYQTERELKLNKCENAWQKKKNKK